VATAFTNNNEVAMASANSSITVDASIATPDESKSHTNKQKSSPMVPCLIKCLNCHESTDEILKVVPEGRFVRCMKCKHINNADDYDPLDFHKAYMFESSKITTSSTSNFKKSTEVAYILSLSNLTRSQTEREAIKFET
jgi:hypothetical protein